MITYVDTSALVKRYVNELTSPAFESFVASTDDELLISPLTVTELQSVLARRLRQGDFSRAFLGRTQELFSADLQNALWIMQPFPPQAFSEAMRLIRELDVALATLDALHLASASALGCTAMATSDRQLARAAERCGLLIHDFSGHPQ